MDIITDSMMSMQYTPGITTTLHSLRIKNKHMLSISYSTVLNNQPVVQEILEGITHDYVTALQCICSLW